MQIRELMSDSVVTADGAASVREVAELMRERNVGSVVLVDGDGPAAIITDRDLAVGVLAEGHDPLGQARGYASAPLVTGELTMTVDAAAELMARHGIRRLPLVEGGTLTGIITLDDLLVGAREQGYELVGEIARASLPGFYFHDRGG